MLPSHARIEIPPVAPTLLRYMSTLVQSKPARRRTARRISTRVKKPLRLELTAEDIALDNAISAAAARSLAARRT